MEKLKDNEIKILKDYIKRRITARSKIDNNDIYLLEYIENNLFLLIESKDYKDVDEIIRKNAFDTTKEEIAKNIIFNKEIQHYIQVSYNTMDIYRIIFKSTKHFTNIINIYLKDNYLKHFYNISEIIKGILKENYIKKYYEKIYLPYYAEEYTEELQNIFMQLI